MPREKPLTQEELREIREILEKEKHVEWFWASARTWAKWVAAAAAATYAAVDFMNRWWPWLLKKFT